MADDNHIASLRRTIYCRRQIVKHESRTRIRDKIISNQPILATASLFFFQVHKALLKHFSVITSTNLHYASFVVLNFFITQFAIIKLTKTYSKSRNTIP